MISSFAPTLHTPMLSSKNFPKILPIFPTPPPLLNRPPLQLGPGEYSLNFIGKKICGTLPCLNVGWIIVGWDGKLFSNLQGRGKLCIWEVLSTRKPQNKCCFTSIPIPIPILFLSIWRFFLKSADFGAKFSEKRSWAPFQQVTAQP